MLRTALLAAAATSPAVRPAVTKPAFLARVEPQPQYCVAYASRLLAHNFIYSARHCARLQSDLTYVCVRDTFAAAAGIHGAQDARADARRARLRREQACAVVEPRCPRHPHTAWAMRLAARAPARAHVACPPRMLARLAVLAGVLRSASPPPACGVSMWWRCVRASHTWATAGRRARGATMSHVAHHATLIALASSRVRCAENQAPRKLQAGGSGGDDEAVARRLTPELASPTEVVSRAVSPADVLSGGGRGLRAAPAGAGVFGVPQTPKCRACGAPALTRVPYVTCRQLVCAVSFRVNSFHFRAVFPYLEAYRLSQDLVAVFYHLCHAVALATPTPPRQQPRRSEYSEPIN